MCKSVSNSILLTLFFSFFFFVSFMLCFIIFSHMLLGLYRQSAPPGNIPDGVFIRICCLFCNGKELPYRSESFGMNNTAFTGTVDAENLADELNDLIEELIQRVIAVAGAFAIFF